MSEPVLPIAQIDAFTDRPFGGNPAAVCLLPSARPEAWMQAVAAEMNLSETAFLSRLDGGFEIRWFTPEVEVELCGHATLASAHALWESGEVAANEPIRFRSASGELTCERGGPDGPGAEGGGEGCADPGGWIWLDFPSLPAEGVGESEEDLRLRATVEAALGAEISWLGRSRFDLLVELASEAAVRGLAPDLHALEALGSRGMIVTAPAASDEVGGNARPDFVSRVFCPGVGIAEDPVTGSAHCCLAPYWSGILGRDRLVGYQASPRGGTVRTVVAGDRVRLGGRAVTVWTGELRA